MPFHWCYQETEALMILLSAIPLIGVFFKQLHARFHNKWKTLCHHEEKCCSMPANIPHGKVDEGQCEQNPLEEDNDGTP
jgi:hypothetical protein